MTPDESRRSAPPWKSLRGDAGRAGGRGRCGWMREPAPLRVAGVRRQGFLQGRFERRPFLRRHHEERLQRFQGGGLGFGIQPGRQRDGRTAFGDGEQEHPGQEPERVEALPFHWGPERLRSARARLGQHHGGPAPACTADNNCSTESAASSLPTSPTASAAIWAPWRGVRRGRRGRAGAGAAEPGWRRRRQRGSGGGSGAGGGRGGGLGSGGGGGGGSAQAQADAAIAAQKRCDEARDKYGKTINTLSQEISHLGGERQRRDCRTIRCYWGEGTDCNNVCNGCWFEAYWEQYYCPCSVLRCKFQATCNSLNNYSCLQAQECGGNCEPADCSR